MRQPKKKKRKTVVKRSSSDMQVSPSSIILQPLVSFRRPKPEAQNSNISIKQQIKSRCWVLLNSQNTWRSRHFLAWAHLKSLLHDSRLPFSLLTHTRWVPMETRRPLLASIHTKCCRLTRPCHSPPRLQHCLSSCKTTSSCSWKRFSVCFFWSRYNSTFPVYCLKILECLLVVFVSRRFRVCRPLMKAL